MYEKTYLLKIGHEMWHFSDGGNSERRGFKQKELNDYIQKQNPQKYKIFCVEDEIEKYSLKEGEHLRSMISDEAYNYLVWYMAYRNRNLNGFSLPINVKSNQEYCQRLDRVLSQYQASLNRPPFVYEDGFLEDIKDTCDSILSILSSYQEEDKASVEVNVRNLLRKIARDDFFVSDLDKSYSFKGIAPFPELHSRALDPGYEEMCADDSDFFRARTKSKDSDEEISTIKQIVHLPYSMKHIAGDMRFSPKGVPALYLGTTTFDCAKECQWDEDNQDFYASALMPNEEGKKLKVLNLTISQALINGMGVYEGNRELQKKMISIFPLVIATSFECDDKIRTVRYEYIISQLLMKYLHEEGIDGIAYLSMRGSDEFQYPHGVNLVLPAYDISEDREYSHYCECFSITKPHKLCEDRGGKRSYINNHYRRYHSSNDSIENFMSKVDYKGKMVFYGNTPFSAFDDYLVSCDMEKFKL